MEKGNTVKKENHENKKKKNQKNHSKAPNKVVNNNSSHPKKAKKNKSNDGEKPVRKNPEKQKGFSFFWFIFTQLIVISVAIGLLYLVDYEKFTRVKLAANASFNKTLSLLPPEVVAKGRKGFDFVRPAVEFIFSKFLFVLGTVSKFLNTNPIVRDHWAFAREIGSVCGALFVDYLRTLYLLTCRCYGKLFP